MVTDLAPRRSRRLTSGFNGGSWWQPPRLVELVSFRGLRPPINPQRTVDESWNVLPQAFRGITLKELWEFYYENKQLLEEKRWRCEACLSFNGQHESQDGPCILCGGSVGELRMRSLYEVNVEMIKPPCENEQISYVELLSRRRGEPRVAVDTFVSHWWGEEFVNFMRAVDRYAHARCSMRRNIWLDALIICVAALLSPVVIANAYCIYVNATHDTASQAHIFKLLFANAVLLRSSWSSVFEVDSLVILAALNGGLILVVFLVFRTCIGWGQDPMKCSFWICAFCNNQFAIDHAIGVAGDVTTSSFATALRSDTCTEVAALLDERGIIYQRIWCAFELFFARVMMPKRFNKSLPVLLINEHGILSCGDAQGSIVKSMKKIVKGIRTAEAQASVESDKIMIEDVMCQQETTHADLDEILLHLAREGKISFRRRRWAVLLLSFAPLIGVELGTLSINFLKAYFLPKKGPEGLGCSVSCIKSSTDLIVMILTLLLWLGLLIFLWCLARGWHVVRRPAELGARLSHRILVVSAVYAIFTIFLNCIRYVLNARGRVTFAGTKKKRLMIALLLSETSTLQFAFVSMIFGLIYVCARDCMVKTRRRLEDLLL